jgi:hypothetical protein
MIRVHKATTKPKRNTDGTYPRYTDFTAICQEDFEEVTGIRIKPGECHKVLFLEATSENHTCPQQATT